MSDSDDSSLPTWLKQHESEALTLQDQSTASDPASIDSQGQAPDHTAPASACTFDAIYSKGNQGASKRLVPEATTPHDKQPAAIQSTGPLSAVLVQAHKAPLPACTDQIPVILTESVSNTRCLVEIGAEGNGINFSGDSGSVGRFLVSGTEEPTVQLDLKGELYSITLMPCASTICVLNMRQTEARVETLTSQYLQLGHARPAVHLQEPPLDHLLADNDEHYASGPRVQADVTTGVKPKGLAQLKKRSSKPGITADSSIGTKKKKKRINDQSG